MVNFPTFVGRARRSESRFRSDFAAQTGRGRLGARGRTMRGRVKFPGDLCR
jgi:hypothetical protein